jgi:hypothetical protein
LRFRFANACASGEDTGIDRIFQFAAWCLQQDPDLEGAAVACFYEHMFEDCTDWEMILGYLSAGQIAGWWVLWDRGLGPVEMRRLYRLIGARYGPDAPEPPRRWYLEDLEASDETLSARAAARRANLPQLLLGALEAYADGARSLEQLLDETATFLIEMIEHRHSSWLGRAWETWQKLADINTPTLREEPLAARRLTPVERADVARLIAELQRIVESGEWKHRTQMNGADEPRRRFW